MSTPADSTSGSRGHAGPVGSGEPISTGVRPRLRAAGVAYEHLQTIMHNNPIEMLRLHDAGASLDQQRGRAAARD